MDKEKKMEPSTSVVDDSSEEKDNDGYSNSSSDSDNNGSSSSNGDVTNSETVLVSILFGFWFVGSAVLTSVLPHTVS